MRVLFIHSLMFHTRAWQQAARRLESCGIGLEIAFQADAGRLLQGGQAAGFDLLVAEAALGQPGFGQVKDLGRKIKHRLALCPELGRDFTTFDSQTAACFRQYLANPGPSNYANGICFLAARAGMQVTYDPPQQVRTTGIYHPEAEKTFARPAEYFTWYAGRSAGRLKPLVGLLFYYSQVMEENTADIDALVRALEEHDLCPLAVFTAGMEEARAGEDEKPDWLKFISGPPPADLVFNLMAGRLLKKASQADWLKELDVPIVQLLRSHDLSPEKWRTDSRGLSPTSIVYSLAQPETWAVVAPVMVAGSQEKQSSGRRKFIPISGRIETLCRRAKRLLRLRELENGCKRIAIVLHNNPCKAVEATVGLATGLDTFASLARLLQALKAAGYDTGNAPESGKAILEDILARKAVSEFRWTTVDEIVSKGGALYLMDQDEYGPWFGQLPEKARAKVLADWGEFPGQAMAWKDNGVDVLVITGICYGKVRIMVQPKRGCYGPKCNGEVCRILHDPRISPPHHWLATYKYIQDNSDAVIHFGTQGALEFLPGKQTALGPDCFPEISIGDLPNFYVYVMDVTGEGLTAKRRGQAVLVDHLVPVSMQAGLDQDHGRARQLLEEYFRAGQMEEKKRREAILDELCPLLERLHLAKGRPGPEKLELVRRRLELARQSLITASPHLLGQPPSGRSLGRLLATMLAAAPAGLPDTAAIAACSQRKEETEFDQAARILADLAAGNSGPADLPSAGPLASFCRRAAAAVKDCRLEIDNLLAGLEGRYIPPVLSAPPERGRPGLLATGRNFFATDTTCLPTPAAWKIGRDLADRLLLKYLEDEGRFPESVGVSIWSSDAFKSDGQLLCQILYLMGVRPVWQAGGEVTGVETIALDELTVVRADGQALPRPRIDVTVQTSGIMRDLVPEFCRLMDQAAVLVSSLDEPDELNFVRKHTRQQMEKLRRETAAGLSDETIGRLARLRVFSSAPGSYSLGVGLALDASAWEKSSDLAEIYINHAAWPFGWEEQNDPAFKKTACRLLADQLGRLDVAFMKQTSGRYDLLSSGCYAVFQGGMAAAAAATGKKSPRLYWTDNTGPGGPDVRDVRLEIERAATARLLNPAWIAGLRPRGYQGAQAVAGQVNTLFKWSGLTGQVPDQLFDAVAETWIMDEENRTWLRQVNPYALEEVTRRLLEAASRGLWQADEKVLEQIRAAALEIEGDMEETMGEVEGEFQGGRVEVLTAAQVDNWRLDWRLEDRK